MGSLGGCVTTGGVDIGLSHSRAGRDLRVPAGHCRKCGYNLTGNVTGVCSECGERVKRPADCPATGADAGGGVVNTVYTTGVSYESEEAPNMPAKSAKELYQNALGTFIQPDEVEDTSAPGAGTDERSSEDHESRSNREAPAPTSDRTAPSRRDGGA